MSTDPTIAFFAGQLGAPRCVICEKLLRLDTTDVFCQACRRRVAPTVARAIQCEHGAFAVGLRGGTTIYFARATCHGEFLTLSGVEQVRPVADLPQAHAATAWPHGIDVRLDEIAWAADVARG